MPYTMKRILFVATLLTLLAFQALPETPQGVYFSKKSYTPAPLPAFDQARLELPAPIVDDEPRLVEMYWKAWQLAFRNFHQPKPGSGYVSNFIDAAFNQNIFLWDTSFMTMFCNYGHPVVPGIGSLDNFYVKQYGTGEICREIDRSTGIDYKAWRNTERAPLLSRWGFGFPQTRGATPITYKGRPAPEPNPMVTLDALDHPILAWAEVESYHITGDRARLDLVWEPLVRYYEALQKYVRQGNGLYMTDWASMDNSPRNTCLAGGGTAIDTSSEMVLFARNLAEIARITGRKSEEKRFRDEARSLAATINRLMWDPARRFYFDLTLEGERCPVKTVAGFWTMLAGVASKAQVDALAAELANPRTFGRFHRVPTLAADEKGYRPDGGYWCGAVWDPTTTMVIRGLEANNHAALARAIALENLDRVFEVYKKTGTVWENYAADSAAPGKPAKSDFVGWSGITPILMLLEHKIGLKPDAATNTLTWRIQASQRTGCERFRFNGHTATLIAEPAAPGRWKVTVDSDGEFTLRAERDGRARKFAVKRGAQSFTM
jgi:hypothetical protein